MNLTFQYDYLKVAVEELKLAISRRDLSNAFEVGSYTHEALRESMRHHALRSRKAFNGELLQAN
jgi:hypothetical protein